MLMVIFAEAKFVEERSMWRLLSLGVTKAVRTNLIDSDAILSGVNVHNADEKLLREIKDANIMAARDDPNLPDQEALIDHLSREQKATRIHDAPDYVLNPQSNTISEPNNHKSPQEGLPGLIKNGNDLDVSPDASPSGGLVVSPDESHSGELAVSPDASPSGNNFPSHPKTYDVAHRIKRLSVPDAVFDVDDEDMNVQDSRKTYDVAQRIKRLSVPGAVFDVDDEDLLDLDDEHVEEVKGALDLAAANQDKKDALASTMSKLEEVDSNAMLGALNAEESIAELARLNEIEGEAKKSDEVMPSKEPQDDLEAAVDSAINDLDESSDVEKTKAVTKQLSEASALPGDDIQELKDSIKSMAEPENQTPDEQLDELSRQMAQLREEKTSVEGQLEEHEEKAAPEVAAINEAKDEVEAVESQIQDVIADNEDVLTPARDSCEEALATLTPNQVQAIAGRLVALRTLIYSGEQELDRLRNHLDGPLGAIIQKQPQLLDQLERSTARLQVITDNSNRIAGEPEAKINDTENRVSQEAVNEVVETVRSAPVHVDGDIDHLAQSLDQAPQAPELEQLDEATPHREYLAKPGDLEEARHPQSTASPVDVEFPTPASGGNKLVHIGLPRDVGKLFGTKAIPTELGIHESLLELLEKANEEGDIQLYHHNAVLGRFKTIADCEDQTLKNILSECMELNCLEQEPECEVCSHNPLL